MRPRRTTAALLLLATCWPAAGAAQPPAAAPQPAPPIVTATRQNAFTIPFRIEPTQNPAEQPVEAQLHVSTDQGANWAASSRVKPDKGSFVFRAPHDGEYWFSIRTVDSQGISRPSGAMQPQLKVSVDTVAPRLDVSVAPHGPDGEIVARWQAIDPNLKPGSFKLEYQAASSGPWERVAVESPPSAMKHTLSGEATWWANGVVGPILVRAEIADLAGNPAVTQAVVKPGSGTGPLAPSPSGMTANKLTTAPPDADGWRPNDSTPANPSTRWPPDRNSFDPLAGSPSAPSNLPENAYPASGAPPGFVPDAQQGTQPVRTPAQQVSSSNVSNPGRPGSPLDFSILPAAVRPRMVAAPSFELEYEIESVGPSGIGRVELWGTRDGGRTWSDFAVDTDNRSPMPVAVGSEGIYGFRILVQSGSGFGGRPPAEGDLPDIWIGVDTTKPTCKILSTEVSPDGLELLLQWEAADDALDPRPVTLLFSENASGPWTPIASGLENSGSYRWKLDNRVPPRILLRLEVRDEAGNVGSFDTSEPLTVDRYRPAGKIRGVRPITQP